MAVMSAAEIRTGLRDAQRFAHKDHEDPAEQDRIIRGAGELIALPDAELMAEFEEFFRTRPHLDPS
jgi:hypothetical protein